METNEINKKTIEQEKFTNYYKRLFYVRCAESFSCQATCSSKQVCKEMGRTKEQMDADIRRIDNVISAVETFIKKAVEDNLSELSK